ncbi:MAG TPA: methyltransferase domain-containing protein [Gaiellaceae bacterium]
MPLSLLPARRLVMPPAEAFVTYDDADYPGGTYAAYNYLSSPVARVKTLHFEIALMWTSDRFGSHAIDFGCADGFFLPSLSRYFEQGFAVDRHPPFLDHARGVASRLGLRNVSVIDNADLSWPELRELVGDDCRVLYLLETLEHVGDPADLYPSKIRFLNELFGLLAANGRIVVSVPTMVGLPFLAQRAVLRVLRMEREPITARQLLDAVLRKDTDALEADWNTWRHLGFNHVKLEAAMRREFRIVRAWSIGVAQIYMLARR